MLCLLCQWIAARRLDDGAEPPRWIARHLDGCPECRAQHERQRRVARRLTAGAAASRVEPSPFLRARILANLDAAPVGEISVTQGRGFQFAASALTLALLALLLWPRGATEMDEDTTAIRAGSPGRVALAALPGLPARDTVLAISSNLDEPLASELRLVMDDAKSAVAVLSRSLLVSERSASRPAPGR